jgi:hypothetical protein
MARHVTPAEINDLSIVRHRPDRDTASHRNDLAEGVSRRTPGDASSALRGTHREARAVFLLRSIDNRVATSPLL